MQYLDGVDICLKYISYCSCLVNYRMGKAHVLVKQVNQLQMINIILRLY